MRFGPRRTYSAVALLAIFGMLGPALTGCSAIVAIQEPPRLFHPYISDVKPAFQMIDRRPTEQRTPRRVEASWYYGDEQFSPSAVQVVTDRFAQAFPKASADTVLVVSELELRYDLARVGDFSPSCTVYLIDCLVTPSIAVEVRRSRNVVNVQLTGTFDGIAFNDAYHAEYEHHVPDRQEERVLSALQGVIDKALTDVHERINTGKHLGQPPLK
jgi:hypothetical protein